MELPRVDVLGGSVTPSRVHQGVGEEPIRVVLRIGPRRLQRDRGRMDHQHRADRLCGACVEEKLVVDADAKIHPGQSTAFDLVSFSVRVLWKREDGRTLTKSEES